MAAQHSPHTTTQVSALQAYSTKKKCPRCGQRSFGVYETRAVKDGRRRRYKCSCCNFRETQYEISSSSYDELLELRRVSRDIKCLISSIAPQELRNSVEDVICYSCEHFGRHGCGFDYPEAGSKEAQGCFNFEQKS